MVNLQAIFEKSKSEKSFDLNDRVLIIDCTNSFIRIITSVPIFDVKKQNTGIIIAFLRSIGMNIRDFKASRCILVFDGVGGSVRRKEIFPEYKANRTGTVKHKGTEDGELSDDEIKENIKLQFERILTYLDCLPLQVVRVNNIEADDVIAFITKQYFEHSSNKIRIVSTDRDFLQLVNDRIEVYSPVKKKIYYPSEIKAELGIIVENYLLYRTLTGDASDNIKGIAGLKLKTIIKLFPDIVHTKLNYDDIFEYARNRLIKNKLYKLILNSKEQLDINHQIMQLAKTDISDESIKCITDVITKENNKLNKIKFLELLNEDSISSSIATDTGRWLYNTFNTLNSWSKT